MRSRGTRLAKEDSMTVDGAILSAKYLSSILTIPESVLSATFLQLELRFRVVGLPTIGRFLSTSAHYLER